jgi:hypothetical protein
LRDERRVAGSARDVQHALATGHAKRADRDVGHRPELRRGGLVAAGAPFVHGAKYRDGIADMRLWADGRDS